LDFLRRGRERDYILALVGFNTGLRISDLRRLRVVDVAHTHVVIRQKKTGKRVRVPINPKIKCILDRYTASMKDEDYLFPSREGWNKPLTRSRSYQILNAAARACGLRHCGNHTLRKTFGFWLYKQSGDVALLQELLGHRHPSITLRYIGIIDSDVDEQMSKFSIGT